MLGIRIFFLYNIISNIYVIVWLGKLSEEINKEGLTVLLHVTCSKCQLS